MMMRKKPLKTTYLVIIDLPFVAIECYTINQYKIAEFLNLSHDMNSFFFAGKSP